MVGIFRIILALKSSCFVWYLWVDVRHPHLLARAPGLSCRSLRFLPGNFFGSSQHPTDAKAGTMSIIIVLRQPDVR
jgi:hypothetical protein